METWNFGGPFGLIMAHFVPPGPCRSLSFGCPLDLAVPPGRGAAQARPRFGALRPPGAPVVFVSFCSLLGLLLSAGSGAAVASFCCSRELLLFS